MKCPKCNSENCKEEEAYWVNGKKMVKIIHCEDCGSFSNR